MMTLEEEQARASEMLEDKIVRMVVRHRSQEVLIEFTDGNRLFIDSDKGVLDLSITDGPTTD